jgi:hypothetical protein
MTYLERNAFKFSYGERVIRIIIQHVYGVMPSSAVSGYVDGDAAPVGWKLITPGMAGLGCAVDSVPHIGEGDGLETTISILASEGTPCPSQVMPTAHAAPANAMLAQ